MHLSGVAFGFFIGLALGLLGGGGSILTVPIFVYLLGFDAKQAIGMSLAVVGATSLVGAIGHWRSGHVNVTVALLFGAVAMVGTYVGTHLAALVSGAFQLAVFGAVMVVASVFMFRGRHGEPHPPPPGTLCVGTSSTPVYSTAGLGLIVGTLTGLVGVGGGFLIVPAMVWEGIPIRDAVGTSLLIIAMNCAVGVVGYLRHVEFVWLAVVLVTFGTIPGIAVGTYLIQFFSQQALRRLFAVFLLVVAVYMLYENMAALRPH